MYTNKKRSENDQYNETSNHIQMKGGGGGAGTPGDAGGTPAAAVPFHLYSGGGSLSFYSFSISGALIFYLFLQV